ncbi:glucose 1-dehydrogenase [Paenibacillus macerans]|uniref:Glucose 1-dehydrogenase n=1 Tax=Paenibacillus macerans TaxID=44252 RepID=A0A6N8ESD6_PAEMA|nr:glucose 1-dehydrogenase [Paenibacillus macerans]MUG21663.1 glucose 1-dehydrogenase [Paenibacillus macerans]UMV46288.1 glucose 1-dehydrogenase [Paenibacillus macerans]
MSFEQLTVIVTGAGQGIGRGVAEAYAKAGASVVLAELDLETGVKAEEESRQIGGKALFVPCDVRKEDDIIRLMETTEREFGSIDILINNAGVSRFKPLFELTVEEWDDVLNTNVRSCFIASREAGKRMRWSGRGGAIVNIASTRAIMSEPGSEAYAASKGAIVSITHALAVSLGQDGIRVNCVSPGWIETGDYGALRGIDHDQHPAGRVGTPADIARACLYLTHPDNTFVTGAHFVVDGGMTRKMIYEP